MELIAASHTKRTQRQFHKTRIKNIMAKQDLLLKDFLHGSNVDFIELQSDMRILVWTEQTVEKYSQHWLLHSGWESSGTYTIKVN